MPIYIHSGTAQTYFFMYLLVLSVLILILPHYLAILEPISNELLEENGLSGVTILSPFWNCLWLSGVVLNYIKG